MFDQQTDRLWQRIVVNGAESATATDMVRLEMYTGLSEPLGAMECALLAEAPEWYDGFKYGILRGQWEALNWALNPDDVGSLLEIIDERKCKAACKECRYPAQRRATTPPARA